jgi:hypothetical protein
MQVNNTRDITLGFIKLKNDSKLYIEVNFKFFVLVIAGVNLFYFR